jgi:hypothetical protein
VTYDELYEHVVSYVAMPHTTITEHDKRRACLILGAFMEFMLDCDDAGIVVSDIDLTGIVNEKLDELEANKYNGHIVWQETGDGV